MGRNCKVSECVSKSLKNFEETVSRKHMDSEEAAGEGLQKSEVNAIGNWKKGDPCYAMTECLATVSPLLMCKENVPNEQVI